MKINIGLYYRERGDERHVDPAGQIAAAKLVPEESILAQVLVAEVVVDLLLQALGLPAPLLTLAALTLTLAAKDLSGENTIGKLNRWVILKSNFEISGLVFSCIETKFCK